MMQPRTVNDGRKFPRISVSQFQITICNYFVSQIFKKNPWIAPKIMSEKCAHLPIDRKWENLD